MGEPDRRPRSRASSATATTSNAVASPPLTVARRPRTASGRASDNAVKQKIVLSMRRLHPMD